MAEDATLLEGRKTKLELSKDATLCGTPKQQRNFIWVAFYALAITCGLVLRRASILEREATLDAAMDPSAWEIKVLNCANLRCHLSVKTSVAFESREPSCRTGRSAAEYAVYSREHEVSSAATEVELYRLRPHTQYVARVRLKAEGFDKIVVVAEQTFESNAVGCNKFDNGPMVRIEGDPSFELLLFPYMDGETDSFRKLEVEDESIHYLAEEFFLLWDPFVEDEPVTELVWVSDYVSLEDAVKALDGEGDNEEQSESVDYYCYSRGVCYVLDAASGSASKAYDYSFPNNGVLSSLHLEAMDVFNKNGGDVVPVPDTRHMLTAFTSVYKTQFASNSYAFETDADGGETKAIIKLPHIEDWTSASGGTSGLYRVLPITSVNGEGAHAPEAWLSHTS
ncbi:hypothetical protein JL720_7671 [Aureococcus anophagefferens]|nr:hypothetical protein JL720_7671 [Aureococcus anophagefferens]